MELANEIIILTAMELALIQDLILCGCVMAPALTPPKTAMVYFNLFYWECLLFPIIFLSTLIFSTINNFQIQSNLF